MFRLISLLAIAGLAFPSTKVDFHTHYISLGQQDSSTAIAADPAGNIFVVSNLAVDAGPGVRVTKTDSQGNVLALFDFGVNSSAMTAAVDISGNLLVAGSTTGTTVSMTQTTGSAGFVARLDSRLTHVMSSATLGNGATGGTSAMAVAVDAPGNVYLTGTTWGTGFTVTAGAYQTFAPQGMIGAVSPSASTYAFITKFTPDLGKIIYSTYFGDGGVGCVSGPLCHYDAATTSATGIAVDSAGVVTIAGSTNSAALNHSNTTIAAPPYGFLARFSPSGGTLIGFLALSPVGIARQSVQSIAVDPAGNLLVAGYASAPPGLFGPAPIQPGIADPVSGTESGGFLAKYDSKLKNLVWGTFFGDQRVNGVALDNQANVWITGNAQISALPGASPAATQISSYIAEISPDGSSLLNLVLSQQLGGQAITGMSGGALAVLGASDSFLSSGTSDQPALLMVANSANNGSSGTIAPVELISLYGNGIGPASPIGGQVANGAFTNTLGGYQVLFNGIPAPLLYAGPNQFNVVAPAAIAGHPTVQINVTGPQGVTAFPTVFVAAARPQIFPLATNPDGTINSPSNPAKGKLTIWATGTGLGTEQQPDGSITPATVPYQALPVTATNVHLGTPVQVTFAGDAPGAVLGLTQVNIQMSAPALINIQIRGAASSNVAVYATTP